MCSNCSNGVVAASNVAYFVLAYWMWRHGLMLWWVLVIVGTVSTIFHIDPSSNAATYIDYTVANLAIIAFFLYYHKHWQNHTLVVYSAITFLVSLFFFFDSGNNRTSGRYVIMHSLWHILTAISCFLLVKSSIAQKIAGGFKP